MKGKKGVSQVVGAAVLIAITVAAVAVIWGVINTFVLDRLETAESCNGILDKISLNNDYTCYNSTSNQTMVSISVKEIDITSLLLALTYHSNNELFELTNESKEIPRVSYYGSTLTEVSMPPKEGGRTYLIDTPTRPRGVQISPKIKTTQCDIVDQIEIIPTCI